MRDYSPELNTSAETSVKVPTVYPWVRFVVCSKCGYALGANLPVLRVLMAAVGRAAQRSGWCKGDHDSTMQHNAQFGAVQVQVQTPVECFGIFTEHLHMICGCCGYRWLTETKPAPVPRAWPFYLRFFLKWFFLCLGLGAFLFLCISAARAQAPMLKDTYSPIASSDRCRVEWTAPTGFSGHGNWMPLQSALVWADASTTEGVPAKVRCEHPHLTRFDWSLFAADEGARALDAYSTERALRCPCNHELSVPAIAAHPAAEYAYSLAIPVAYLGLSAFLEHHHHSRWAKFPLLADIGYDLPQGWHNMTLRTTPSTRIGLHRF